MLDRFDASDTRMRASRLVRGSTLVVKFILLVELGCTSLYFFPIGIAQLMHADYLGYHGGFHLSIAIALSACAVYGYFNARHRFATFFSAGIAVLAFFTCIWEPFIRESRVFWAWGFFGIMQIVYICIFVFAALFSIFHIIVISIARYEQHEWEKRNNQDKTGITWQARHAMEVFARSFKRHKAFHATLIAIITASSLCILGFDQWLVGTKTITITPGDYNVEFAGYGDMNPALFTNESRQAMSDHGMLMVVHGGYWVSYNTWLANRFTWQENITNSTEFIQGRQNFIDNCTYWKENYPGIKLILLVHGMPCGFATDYSVTNSSTGVGGSLWYAWHMLTAAVENNLTNVVGLHTDQEDCAEDWWPIVNDTITRDAERNLQATQAYLEFFDRLETSSQQPTWQSFFAHMNATYGIDHFLFTTTYNGGLVVDGLDGDHDLDVFNMNNVLQVPYDEFLPMLYNSYAKTPDDAHTQLYIMASLLRDSLAGRGHGDRIGALLGICNEARFNANGFFEQWNGSSMENVSGFNVLARQVLIAKAFNVKRISFFTLHNCCNIYTGAFDAYGPDFLENLNDTVNGPGSREPFEIVFKPNVDNLEIDFARDLFLNPNAHVPEILIVVIFTAAIIAWMDNTKQHEKLKKKLHDINTNVKE